MASHNLCFLADNRHVFAEPFGRLEPIEIDNLSSESHFSVKLPPFAADVCQNEFFNTELFEEIHNGNRVHDVSSAAASREKGNL